MPGYFFHNEDEKFLWNCWRQKLILCWGLTRIRINAFQENALPLSSNDSLRAFSFWSQGPQVGRCEAVTFYWRIRVNWDKITSSNLMLIPGNIQLQPRPLVPGQTRLERPRLSPGRSLLQCTVGGPPGCDNGCQCLFSPMTDTDHFKELWRLTCNFDIVQPRSWRITGVYKG